FNGRWCHASSSRGLQHHAPRHLFQLAVYANYRPLAPPDHRTIPVTNEGFGPDWHEIATPWVVRFPFQVVTFDAAVLQDIRHILHGTPNAFRLHRVGRLCANLPCIALEAEKGVSQFDEESDIRFKGCGLLWGIRSCDRRCRDWG